jgi:hypothetical protein
VTFDQAVDPASAPDGFRLLDARQREVPGALEVGASPNVLVFEPERRLTLLGSYTVRMTSMLKGESGGRLAEPYNGGFIVRDGAWSAPQRLASASDPGWRDLELSSSAGFDGAGNAVAVWSQENEHQRDDVWASTQALDGTWNEPQLLLVSETDESEQSPRVAVASDGSAVAVWRRCCEYPSYDTLWFNTYDPEDGWSAPAAVPAPEDFRWNVVEPVLAGDGNGNVTALWSQIHNLGTVSRRIWSSTFSRDEGWSLPEVLEEDAAGYDVGLHVAGSGDAMSMWSGYSGIRAGVRAAGQWAPPLELQAEGSPIGVDPELAASAGGHAIAAWLNGATSAQGAVWTSVFDPAEGWGQPERVDAHVEVEFPYSAWTPSAAIDREGNALVVWAFGYQDREIWVNRYDREQGWASPEVIGGGVLPAIAVDSNGHAMAVWRAGTEVRFSRYVAGAGWSASELLGSDDYFVASEVELVTDSDGRNLALWHTWREERVEDDWVRFTRVYSASFE